MKKNIKLVLGFLFIFTALLNSCRTALTSDEEVLPKSGNFNLSVSFDESIKSYCNYVKYNVFKDSSSVDGYIDISGKIENNKLSVSSNGKAVDAGDYKVVFTFFIDEKMNYETFSIVKNFTVNADETASLNICVTEQNKSNDVSYGFWGKTDGNPNNVRYIVNDTKLYVFGNGEIYESDYDAIPGITECYIDDGITSIGTKAFYHSSIKKLCGGNNVTTISENAFKDCIIEEIDGFNAITTMTKTTFGNSFSKFVSLKGLNGITSIDANAFSGCNGLKELDGFNGITSVGKQAFSSCTALKKVNGFASLETTGEQMFYKCSSLTTLTGFDSLKTIAPYSFNECSALSTISSFSNVETIGASAFLRCSSLVEIDGFNSALSLGEHAFEYCENLESVKGFQALTSFGKSAFNECGKIKTIEGFNSLEETPKNAFSSALVLETISGFDSIKIIGEATICNTVALKTFSAFNYNGTCDDFANVVIPNWETRNKFNGKIYCTDGKYTGTIKASN